MIAIAAAAASSFNPWTIGVSAAVALIVGALGFWGSQRAVKRAGENSDRALARTIEADREGRLLELRLALYSEFLTFSGLRRQHRDVTMAIIVVKGWTRLDPFDPEQIFGLLGRAHALAEASVLTAFTEADEADMAVTRHHNYMQIVRTSGTGNPDAVKDHEKLVALQAAAEEADAVLEIAIRSALHGSPIA